MLALSTLLRQHTALPNDVMSKIECGQLHSVLFGRRHSTLQSHGFFALAKILLLLHFNCVVLPWQAALRIDLVCLSVCLSVCVYPVPAPKSRTESFRKPKIDENVVHVLTYLPIRSLMLYIVSNSQTALVCMLILWFAFVKLN